MKKTFDKWKLETAQNIQQQANDKKREEFDKKQKEMEAELYSYAVIKDGKKEHETKSIHEAINLAKTIRAKVWWLIEGIATSEIEIN